MEHCQNCEREIGNLETVSDWQGHLVCGECAAKLASEQEPSDTVSMIPDYASPAQRRVGAREIICPNPNCGFIGKPSKESKGSALVMIFLLILGVWPGILYAIVYNGYRLNCPRCGMKVRDA